MPDGTVAVAATPGPTPCLLAALKGIVGDCLKVTATVTPADAMYMPYDPERPVLGYIVDPSIPVATQYEFSTLEQAQAIQAILQFKYPGSDLTITDYVSSFSFSPFRKIQYMNDGGLFAPRLYKIIGTLNIPDGGQAPTQFSVGWLVNVKGVLFRGINTWTERMGYPVGTSDLILVNEMGLLQPEWVGGPKNA